MTKKYPKPRDEGKAEGEAGLLRSKATVRSNTLSRRRRAEGTSSHVPAVPGRLKAHTEQKKSMLKEVASR